MTDNDEETKEHPIYPEAPAPAVPMAVDPLGPTTTVHVTPALPPAPPIYPPPNQGWPGQPPGPPSFPSAQGPWQSTGYGQPGYGPPAGYAATAPAHRTSVVVALAALILVVFGVAVAVLGAWLLTQGPALNDLIQRVRGVDLFVFKPTRDQLKMAFSASPGAFMVLGVLQLLVGAFVLAHRGWARWLGAVLALIGLLLSVVSLALIMALVAGISVELIVSATLLIGYAFVVLALIAGSGHFKAPSQGR